MKKVILIIFAIIFILLNFTSCIISDPEKQKEYVKNMQDKHQQYLLDHFDENEKTFNEIVNNFIQYYDDYKMYDSVEIFSARHDDYHYYVVRTWIYPNGTTHDFFSSPISNNIIEAELSKIFLDKNDYRSNSTPKSNTKKYSRMFFSIENENEIYFNFRDWDISLIYSISGELAPLENDSHISAHEEYKINDNWYIRYYLINR